MTAPIKLAVLMFLVGLSFYSLAQEKGLSAEDRERVEAMTRMWLAAHAERDWEQLALQYTDDAILMPPFAPIIQGRTAIRDWFAANENHTSIHVEILEIEGYEDLAYVRGASRITIKKPGQEPVTFEGKYLDIRRRTEDGSWKVSVDMFSPDTAVE